MKSPNCKICSKEVAKPKRRTSADPFQGFRCPGCFEWCHFGCTDDFPDYFEDEYDWIHGFPGSVTNLIPFCDSCARKWDELCDSEESDNEPSMVGLFKSDEHVQSDVAKLSSKVDMMVADLAKMKETMSVKLAEPQLKMKDLVKEAVAEVVSQSSNANDDLNKRLRSVVIDGLPEKANRADSVLVNDLLGFVAGKGYHKALEVHRLGPEKTDNPAHRKVKVLLASVTQQANLLSKATRNRLRNSPESKRDWPNVFISPLRGAAENDKLYHLRRRRDLLNIGLDRANSWFVDSVRIKLGKLTNGSVDWSATDDGFDQWMRSRAG